MAIEVQQKFFSNRMEAFDDIARQDFWPMTIVAQPGPATDAQWYETDLLGYVIEGEMELVESESGTRVQLGQGDRFRLPAGTLYREQNVQGRVVYLLAFPEAPLNPTLKPQVLNPPEALAEWKARA